MIFFVALIISSCHQYTSETVKTRPELLDVFLTIEFNISWVLSGSFLISHITLNTIFCLKNSQIYFSILFISFIKCFISSLSLLFKLSTLKAHKVI